MQERRLDRAWFDLVKVGKKRVECRPLRDAEKKLRVGDTLRFVARDTDPAVVGEKKQDTIDVKVTKLVPYPSFAGMLRSEGVEPVLPGVPSVEAGVCIYHSIPNYQELEAQFGVLAIHLST